MIKETIIKLMNQKGLLNITLILVCLLILIIGVGLFFIKNTIDKQKESEWRELMNQSFDNNRFAALEDIQKTIELSKPSEVNIAFYCKGATDQDSVCFGSSIEEPIYGKATKSTGEGWIKMDLSKHIVVLPLDVKNDQNSHFVYCANNDGWEINSILDSEKYKNRLQNDGGDDSNKYEIGTNLNLIDRVPECNY